jgi:type VII secretion integral membrane protein EccD
VALRVPPTVTVADLISEAMAAVGGELETATHWVLALPKGDVLEPDRGVGQLGLLDGSLLILRPATEAETENVREDLPEAVASALEEATGRWSSESAATVAAVACAGLTLAAAVAVWMASPDLVCAVLAFGAGLGVVLASALLARTVTLARVGRWTALASLPLWAVGGASAIGAFPAGIPAASALAVLAGAMLILLMVPGMRSPAVGAILAAAVFGLGSAVVVPVDLPSVVPTVVVALLALAALGLLPRIAIGLAGVLSIDSAEQGGDSGIASSVAEARGLLGWMLVGLSSVLGLVSVQLALSDGPFALALAGAVALITLLRARHHSFVAEIAPLAGAALVGFVTVEVALIDRLAPAGMTPFVGVGMAFADGLLVAMLALVAGEESGSVDTRRWLSRLEYTVVAAVIPLAVGALGVYDFVFNQAKHLL